MSKLFKNKYRIDSIRHSAWDYSWNAEYFVTICTGKHKNYFGCIENNDIVLSVIGKVTDKCWQEIPKHFPFVKLNSYTIMPNHIHGIIIINNPVDTQNSASNSIKPIPVETQYLASGKYQEKEKKLGNVETQNLVSKNEQEITCNKTQDIASLQKQLHLGNEHHFSYLHDNKTQNSFSSQSYTLGSIIRGFKIGVKKYTNSNNLNFNWQPRFHDRIIRNE
jgi:putative transposase